MLLAAKSYVENIRPLVDSLQQLIYKQLPLVEKQVATIIANSIRSPQKIEPLLDTLLNFMAMGIGTDVFRKLLYHYAQYYPEYAASYEKYDPEYLSIVLQYSQDDVFLELSPLENKIDFLKEGLPQGIMLSPLQPEAIENINIVIRRDGRNTPDWIEVNVTYTQAALSTSYKFQYTDQYVSKIWNNYLLEVK